MKDKLVTIDVECDGAAASVNKRLFPQTPHWDPNSRIWCISFTEQVSNTSLYKTHTLVCKLPNNPRYIGTLEGREIFGAKHEIASKVPSKLTMNNQFNTIPTVNITEYTHYNQFLDAIMNKFIELQGSRIYSKGYGPYNFDKYVLEKELSKNICGVAESPETPNNIPSKVGLPILTFNPTEWVNTAPQVKRGQYIPNQEYMINGIRHNIEDTEQLYYCVLNGMGV